MGIFNFFKKSNSDSEPIVRVEFVNGADNSIIAVSNMPAAQLPDSFAINTNLDIKDEKWSVQVADPIEKAQFAKTGKLRLVLSRVTLVNPKNILFSLPTISDDIGNAQGAKPPKATVFLIHEDDWRQVEFVSTQFDSEIHEEFADIRQIWNSEKSGPAFRKLHVRKRIPNPLAGSVLYLNDLKSIIQPQNQFDFVGFHNAPGIVPLSFAWRWNGQLVVWGITDAGGKVLRLCLSGLPETDEVLVVGIAFATLTERYQLSFVDWCRTIGIRSNAVSFEEYFAQRR